MIEPPTKEETDQAITGNMSNILVIVCHLGVYLRSQLTNLQDESGQEVQECHRTKEASGAGRYPWKRHPDGTATVIHGYFKIGQTSVFP